MGCSGGGWVALGWWLGVSPPLLLFFFCWIVVFVGMLCFFCWVTASVGKEREYEW